MKAEDLKVGMVFEDRRTRITHRLVVYRKIFKILNDRVFYYYFHKDDNELGCFCDLIDSFLSFEQNIIDKVPPRIEEVEEEVAVYILKSFKDKLLKYGFVNPILRAVHSVDILTFEPHEGMESDYTELCKIKHKVTKELNWDWESAEWK